MSSIILLCLSLFCGRVESQNELNLHPDNGFFLVENNSSDYVIFHEPDAPESLIDAAEEIQRVIQISTGVSLPVQTTATSKMICLGENMVSNLAGVSCTDVRKDGFKIVTKENIIYILGQDTRDGEEEWQKWIFRGTYYGVCSFLERFVGARWLIPGPWGEDIPFQSSIYITDINIFEEPHTLVRDLWNIKGTIDENPENRELVHDWKLHNGLHTDRWISFGHSYGDYITEEELEDHPEWLAMDENGIRWTTARRNYKYCLTDPQLQRVFANRIINKFDENPNRYHASMSPSDGTRFCYCPECKELLETNDGGQWGNFAERGWSVTPVVLQFYNKVAKIIGDDFPDRIVGGYVYNAYTYPPVKVTRLEQNLVLNIAVLDHYGYKLYKPERNREFKKLLPAWSVYTSQLAITDYSTWMRDWYGLPLPPGRSILKLLFHMYSQYPLVFINYIGHNGWGTGGVHNYIVSKLLWDPDLDVDEIYYEFLNRAYGEEAALRIDNIYNISDQILSAYIQRHEGFRNPDYESSYELVKDYSDHFHEIELLYSTALNEVHNEQQEKRLEMFGDNLTLLYYNMIRAGLVDEGQSSMFYLSEMEFIDFIEDRKTGLSLAACAKPGYKDRPLKLLSSPDIENINIERLDPEAPPPLIDGRLDDSCWSSGSLITGFKMLGKDSLVEEQTAVRVLYNEQSLYLGIICQNEDLKSLPKLERIHDSEEILNDENIGIFIGHYHPYIYTGYWNLRINMMNNIWDGQIENFEYDLDFTSMTEIDSLFWMLEVEIPFESLNLENAPWGSTWHCNITRTCRDENEHVISTWSSLQENIHEPENFGEWNFGIGPWPIN